MNPLYLSSFNVSLAVDRARLIVRNGIQFPDREPESLGWDITDASQTETMSANTTNASGINCAFIGVDPT
jgi:hypothetical protein